MSDYFSISCFTLSPYSKNLPQNHKNRVRDVLKQVKYGRTTAVSKILVREHIPETVIPSLNCLLVPIPRSSPLIDGGMWPSLEICKALINNGIGNDIRELIKRVYSVKSAHKQIGADNRPKLDEHIESMEINSSLVLEPKYIVLVDDVITQGRTSAACYSLLKKQYQDAEISVFTVFRTDNDSDTSMLDPKEGRISVYPSRLTHVDYFEKQ